MDNLEKLLSLSLFRFQEPNIKDLQTLAPVSGGWWCNPLDVNCNVSICEGLVPLWSGASRWESEPSDTEPWVIPGQPWDTEPPFIGSLATSLWSHLYWGAATQKAEAIRALLASPLSKSSHYQYLWLSISEDDIIFSNSKPKLGWGKESVNLFFLKF